MNRGKHFPNNNYDRSPNYRSGSLTNDVRNTGSQKERPVFDEKEAERMYKKEYYDENDRNFPQRTIQQNNSYEEYNTNNHIHHSRMNQENENQRISLFTPREERVNYETTIRFTSPQKNRNY
ncbi:hypothetical protein M0813_06667 [Anaeramoeba flamelloides]|uniref:Uncharacterized protein n=1 Tax=Anaeramoeba flamelloides TaxID=1746091 RepID=A0ABQ8XEY3_9EUKA|nr:hypothetical protein M0813_06667 [Anaeramoeba flamelloides]